MEKFVLFCRESRLIKKKKLQKEFVSRGGVLEREWIQKFEYCCDFECLRLYSENFS